MIDALRPEALPLYQCHKQVRAARIVEVLQLYDADDHGDERWITRLVLDVGGFIDVDRAFRIKHQPAIGGYLVVYDDGAYLSYSPAAPFEAGYTRINP